MRKGRTWPNKPDAANPAVASRFHAGPHWRGVADPGRWAKQQGHIASTKRSKSARCWESEKPVRSITMSRSCRMLKLISTLSTTTPKFTAFPSPSPTCSVTSTCRPFRSTIWLSRWRRGGSSGAQPQRGCVGPREGEPGRMAAQSQSILQFRKK